LEASRQSFDDTGAQNGLGAPGDHNREDKYDDKEYDENSGDQWPAAGAAAGLRGHVF
jgi:hypothetical protein